MTFMQIVHWLACLIPHALWRKIGGGISKIIVVAKPKLRIIAHENLTLAFPELTYEQKDSIYRDSLTSFVNVFIDGLFSHKLTKTWIDKHVRYDQMSDVLKQSINPTQGMLLATGHLGSFELFGNCLGVLGIPLSAVAREMKPKFVDDWWNGVRAQTGNQGIPRTGAVKGMIKALREKRFIGLLMDQNVRDKHAVFLPWFGKVAATTGALALAALRTKCPIVVLVMRRLDAKDAPYKYEAICRHVEVSDIYGSDTMSLEEQGLEITRRTSDILQDVIKTYPREWFWFHKRYRTRPPSELVAPVGSSLNT